jgi:hypothetical protein
LFSSFCVLDAAFHPEHRVKILLVPENSAADESLLPRIVELEKILAFPASMLSYLLRV